MKEWAYPIWVGVLCLLAFAALYAGLLGGPIALERWHIGLGVQLPVLAIVGVMTLLASLALVSLTFSVAGLSDQKQALGLPEGSVRAVIALSLIVLFAITSVYFHGSLAKLGLQQSGPLSETDAGAFRATLRPEEFIRTIPSADGKQYVVVYRLGTEASDDFAKQVLTLLGTLMTSVASFYFAASTASAGQARPQPSSPTVTSVSPQQVAPGEEIELQLVGAGLLPAQSLKLKLGSTEIPADNVLSRDAEVKAKVKVPTEAPVGVYDVIVTNADGRTAALPASLTIRANQQVPSPKLTSVSPRQAARDQEIQLLLSGSGLQTARSVTLKQGPNEIPAAEIEPGDAEVKATVKVPTDATDGSYDVIVTNTDGGTAILPASFTVTAG